jgi:hypothetical protein
VSSPIKGEVLVVEDELSGVTTLAGGCSLGPHTDDTYTVLPHGVADI